MQKVILYSLVFLTIFVPYSYGQNRVEEVRAEAKKLKKAMDARDPHLEAQSYLNLADGYFADGSFEKSEIYYSKAQKIFEEVKDEKNLAIVTRKLAQSQERQKKITLASQNYFNAAQISENKKTAQINDNDYQRLNARTTVLREKAATQNVLINSNDKNSEELAADYKNLAEIQAEQKNIPKATENLNVAYDISKESQPKQAIKINQQIADLYVQTKDFSKAIEVKKKVLEEDFVKKNSEEKVSQIQELADIYLKSNEADEAIKLLRNAYKIAMEKGHTLEAHKAVLKMDSIFSSVNNSSASIALYQDFLHHLPSTLDKDESLADEKILKETEERILQLETEKKLQKQLLHRKNLFNYALIFGLILAIGFSAYALFTQRKLKTQNKKIELQSLRREMNPHFIFNSLNSINQFIAENNELEANQYLTKFSKLMRGVMENSKDDFIPLSEELDLLKNYLALEKSRFQDKFDFEISLDEHVQNQNVQIPGMLIQPFLENAIWHGLRYRAESGFLHLNIKKNGEILEIEIEDNGIGIAHSKAQKTNHQKQKNGRGMKNTLERIQLLNDLYGKNITCFVKDKQKQQGVLVQLKMNV